MCLVNYRHGISNMMLLTFSIEYVTPAVAAHLRQYNYCSYLSVVQQ
jgi:hypothetical protein